MLILHRELEFVLLLVVISWHEWSRPKFIGLFLQAKVERSESIKAQGILMSELEQLWQDLRWKEEPDEALVLLGDQERLVDGGLAVDVLVLIYRADQALLCLAQIVVEWLNDVVLDEEWKRATQVLVV